MASAEDVDICQHHQVSLDQECQNFSPAGGQVFHLLQRGLQAVDAARAPARLLEREGHEAGQEQPLKEPSSTVVENTLGTMAI